MHTMPPEELVLNLFTFKYLWMNAQMQSVMTQLLQSLPASQVSLACLAVTCLRFFIVVMFPQDITRAGEIKWLQKLLIF